MDLQSVVTSGLGPSQSCKRGIKTERTKGPNNIKGRCSSASHHQRKGQRWLRPEEFILVFLTAAAAATVGRVEAQVSDEIKADARATADFGGDFSAEGLSGNTAPGPTASVMGSQPASAMAIGTGGSGPGDYTSSFKTPNYTQYAQQDFKGMSCYYLHTNTSHKHISSILLKTK